MQSSSQIITTNKPTPSLFYKPDALPVAPKNSVKAMKGISKDMIHKIKHRDSLDWHLAQHITGWKYRALTTEPVKIYDKMWHSSNKTVTTDQMNSRQMEQKVGCLKNVAMNLWPLTWCTRRFSAPRRLCIGPSFSLNILSFGNSVNRQNQMPFTARCTGSQ